MDRKKKYRKRPLEDHLSRFENIASYLKESRRWTGLSREDFAQENNLSRSLLDRVESGKCNLQLSTVFDLCDLYDMPVSELFAEIS